MVSHSVMFDSLQSNGLQPVRLLCPWNYPGKNTGVPFPTPGDLPDPEIKLMSPALAGGFFTTSDTKLFIINVLPYLYLHVYTLDLLDPDLATFLLPSMVHESKYILTSGHFSFYKHVSSSAPREALLIWNDFACYCHLKHFFLYQVDTSVNQALAILFSLSILQAIPNGEIGVCWEGGDEMAGWHHQLDGHEFEQSPGVGDWQGSLACFSPWGRKESDTSDWTELRGRDTNETMANAIMCELLAHAACLCALVLLLLNPSYINSILGWNACGPTWPYELVGMTELSSGWKMFWMHGNLMSCFQDSCPYHPHGKEMQKSKMAVWGGLTNSCEKKRSEKQRSKGKI